MPAAVPSLAQTRWPLASMVLKIAPFPSAEIEPAGELATCLVPAAVPSLTQRA